MQSSIDFKYFPHLAALLSSFPSSLSELLELASSEMMAIVQGHTRHICDNVGVSKVGQLFIQTKQQQNVGRNHFNNACWHTCLFQTSPPLRTDKHTDRRQTDKTEPHPRCFGHMGRALACQQISSVMRKTKNSSTSRSRIEKTT